MFAAEGGYADVVQNLLDAGANPNRVTAEGDSALEFARQNDNPMVIQMLETLIQLFLGMMEYGAKTQTLGLMMSKIVTYVLGITPFVVMDLTLQQLILRMD